MAPQVVNVQIDGRSTAGPDFDADALRSLRDEHARPIKPARAQAAEGLQLERRLSDLVTRDPPWPPYEGEELAGNLEAKSLRAGCRATTREPNPSGQRNL